MTKPAKKSTRADAMPKSVAEAAVTFTKKEGHLMTLAWLCVQGDLPETSAFDAMELAKLAGFDTEELAFNTLREAMDKVKQFKDGEMPQVDTAIRNRGRKAVEHDEEALTGGESAPKKQHKSSVKKQPQSSSGSSVCKDKIEERDYQEESKAAKEVGEK